jgi:hypothetical protein
MSEWAEQRSIPVTETGCWLWLGCVDGNGYGLVMEKRVCKRAHRASWEKSVGTIPAKMQILHRCDTPRCVNPGHLFIGSNADNVADKVMKRRQARGSDLGKRIAGEKNGHSKLTKADADLIRSSSERGVVLASRFKISQSVVSEIRTGKMWKEYTK